MYHHNSTWRLIPLLKASGKLQMAIDAWLLEQHSQGKHPPTLRFYTWDPVAISLGYHQRRWPPMWQHLTWQGKPVELVRRQTGGRAVLHQGDLTYMVVTSGLPQRRLEAYQTLCQFLIAGWRTLGFELHYGSAGRGYIHNPNCFATSTGADLVLSDGYKLIGSAQLRRNGAILQQGSMCLESDAELYQQVFGVEFLPSIVLSGSQLSLSHHLIIEALMQAACDCFQIELKIEPLSEEEWHAIKVYSNPE